FSTEEQSVPYFAFIDDGTFHPMDVGTINQQNATYSVPTATVSEPDEDGNVTYSIQYSIVIPFTATFPMDYQQEVFNGFIYPGMDVMDYYTGIVFPAQNLTEENGHESNLSSDVTWEDVTYTVSVNKVSTMTNPLNDSYQLDNDTWEWDAEYDIDYNIEIIAPKDYDGAILSLNLNGNTEYEEVDSEEVTEAHVFGDEEDEAVSNYVFFRLKDIIQQEDEPEKAE
ncbi:MAG: hypothetical protein IJ648_03155, partial [Lachnospiraceae bacterium]|nr:hypothetical protein [Lachnospiraceae bacterium]